MEAVIELKDLTTGYRSGINKKAITSNINTSLLKGELVCLIGPNGAGKSTLMRTLSGSQKPIKGMVFLEGKNIHDLSPRILAKKLSLVLTERVSAGMLTAYEIVALGRFPYTNWSGKLKETDHRIIHEAIEMVGAQELAKRPLSELSDGERQKIMVARAFAQEPEVMILDEVTAFLDLPRRVEIMRLLRKMARESSKSILLSTHDMDLALRGADKIWLLPKGGDLQVGAPEDLVLDGSFQKAFNAEGIQFDKHSGSFQIHTNYHAKVDLQVNNDLAIWTKRALERNGIKIDNRADTKIIVQSIGEKNQWTVIQNKSEKKANSIHGLIIAINEILLNKIDV
ncbi:MAG: ABC transporter ATP-binding protein [Leptolyngbya sp. SIO3F4]|nr:ABC transporter ATP-binding protein [Leptolyngbya sp. SIO3F4]